MHRTSAVLGAPRAPKEIHLRHRQIEGLVVHIWQVGCAIQWTELPTILIAWRDLLSVGGVPPESDLLLDLEWLAEIARERHAMEQQCSPEAEEIWRKFRAERVGNI